MTELEHSSRLRFLQRYHNGEVGPGFLFEEITAWRDSDSLVELHVHLGMTWAEYQRWENLGELPTRQAHSAQRWDATAMLIDGRTQMLRVHPPTRCRPACPVHWPTAHPLARAAKWWDPLEGVMRRICPHDLDHPDPDDQQVRLHPELLAHRCDGCCTAEVIDGSLADPHPLPTTEGRA